MQRPVLLTREEAAKYIGTTYDTLRVWACTQRYKIPYRKIGKKVEYLKSDLDKFIQDRTRFR